MKFPDYIYYKAITGDVRGFCLVTNIHDGMFYVILQRDHKEHIIPAKSVIEIIRNAKGDAHQ